MSDPKFENDKNEDKEDIFGDSGDIGDDENILSGFPSSFGDAGFEEEDEDEEEEEASFEGFEDDTSDPSGLLDGIDDSVNDISDEDLDEDDGFDPEVGFDEDDEEEGSEDEDLSFDHDEERSFEDEDHFNEEEDEDDQAGSKNTKYIFYAAVAAIAIGAGTVGYTVVLPSIFGSNSAPVQQTVSGPPPAFTPQGIGRPAPAVNVAQNSNIPSLPAPVTMEKKVQLPGVAPGVDSQTSRPEFDGGMQLEVTEFVPNAPTVVKPQPLVNEIDTAVVVPTPPSSMEIENVEVAQPIPADNPDMDKVIGKLDSVLTRLDSFEDKFVTKEDVAAIVSGQVADQVKELTKDSASDSQIDKLMAEIKTLSGRIETIEKAEPKSSTDVAEVEKLIEERFTKVNDRLREEGEKLKKEAEKVEAEKKALAKKKVEKPSVTAKLQSKVRAQQRELVALKAKGANYNPPAKPRVLREYRLAGMSNHLAWIESSTGVSRYGIGQKIPGAGVIEEFKKMNGNFAIITSQGIIIP